jgi:predicted unusual protein kinase regulating ubiquinone biosynthesis (AarF/ABC1/UbiB family)
VTPSLEPAIPGVELGTRERFRRAARTGGAIAGIYIGYKGLHWLDRGPLRGVVGVARRRWDRFSASTLNDAATELGGVLLKAGQYLSTRADVLPPAYVERLARLQDRARPLPYTVVRRVIAEDLGAEPEAIFARIWRRPIASASLAQVHRATLADGREVAIKVQRPDVRSALHADLGTLRVAVRAIESLEGALGFSLLLDQLEHSLERELDFRLEAESAGRMAASFACDARVRIPYVVPEFTRRRVLVTEYLPGIRVTDRSRLERAGVDCTQVLDTLLDAYAVQVFSHGFFHGDPHPGNLLVLPGAGGAFQLCFVDFGIVQEVPEGFQVGVVALVQSVLARDPAGTASALAMLGLATRDPEAGTIERIAERLTDALRRADAEGFPAVVAELGNEISDLLRDDPLASVPPHVFLLGRVLGLLSGVSAQLGVRVNLVRALLPRLFEGR